MGSFQPPWFHLGNISQLGSRSLILETNFPYCLLNLTPFFQGTTEHRGPPGGALCSQLVQWREEMCSCFKYIRVLYFLTPTRTNSPSSPTIQFILHGLQGSVPQVCPHSRGQSQMECSSYPHFCPTTRSAIPSDPLLRVDNFTRMTHIHKWMDKEDGLHVYKGI